MAWSRYRFVRFGADQTRATTLALLVECFEELGGVPAVVLSDRMGCLKAGVVANVVVPHPEYVQSCAHYGCRPDFCEGADPESKGVVENLCGYAQRDLVVPALLAPAWPDLPTVTAAARAWCAEVNGAVHSETCAVPAERLASEREVLRLGLAEALEHSRAHGREARAAGMASGSHQIDVLGAEAIALAARIGVVLDQDKRGVRRRPSGHVVAQGLHAELLDGVGDTGAVGCCLART